MALSSHRSQFGCWLGSLGASVIMAATGCGGSAAPTRTTADIPAASEPPDPEPARSAEAQKPKEDEKWEGEDEATKAASGTGASGAEARTNEVIAKVIRDNRKPFRDCYEKAAKEQPGIEGTLTLHFVLTPDGKVKSAELNRERSTLTAPTAVDCAVSALKTLKFPPSSRGMESVVNYPFDFKR
ncbi:MAG TPA: AgmX/PglI C-terminal domain-containing protein [Polyangiaceae bacterium]|nr:AgmX/PglI C-terminal domain-containing protein [Polyangiaceae bacterium]